MDYAEAGFTPVRLKPRKKTPVGAEWQAKATRDPKAIRKAFKKDSNVGLQMGQIDPQDRQLFCFDVDTKNGANLANFVKAQEWPRTANAQTCSGGSHFLFWSAPGTRVYDSQDALGRGFDLKGLMGDGTYGGQIVVEPSVYEDPDPARSGPYAWIVPPTSLESVAQAPDWLMDRIRKHQGAAKTAGKTVAKPKTKSKAKAKAKAKATAAPTRRAPSEPTTLLAQALERFPLSDQKGDRDNQMVGLTTWLICKGETAETAEGTITAWWDHWHQTGIYHSPSNPNAIKAQIAYAERSLASGKITACKSKPITSRPVFDVLDLDPSELIQALFLPHQQPVVEHLILNVPSETETGTGTDRGTPPKTKVKTTKKETERLVRTLCLIRAVLILLAEDRAGGPDHLFRTTIRELAEVLQESFGLEVPLNGVSRLFGRLRARSDRSGLKGFEGQGPQEVRPGHLLEEVKVGQWENGVYGPSVFRPTGVLEQLLAMDGCEDWAGEPVVEEPVVEEPADCGFLEAQERASEAGTASEPSEPRECDGEPAWAQDGPVVAVAPPQIVRRAPGAVLRTPGTAAWGAEPVFKPTGDPKRDALSMSILFPEQPACRRRTR